MWTDERGPVRVASALVTARPVLSVLFGVGALGACVGWAYTSGWRLRGPVWRLPLSPEPDPAEQARKEAARKVRDALLQLFHASAKPAIAKAEEILAATAAKLKAMPEPHHSLGVLTELFSLREVRESVDEVRGSLEGGMWRLVQDEQSASLREFVAERALEANTAESFGTAFYSFYRDYRLLIPIAKRLATIAGFAADPWFEEWRSLDERFTIKLRETIALPELATQRDDFEEWIAKWPPP